MKYDPCVLPEFQGKLDSRLAQVAKQLGRELDREQRSFAAKSLRLDKEEIAVFSGILVDFAVDWHADVGIWQAYERFNADTFGDPLPLTGGTPSGPFCPERLRHLIWKTYSNIFDGMVIDPAHGDLRAMAERASAFLQKKFASLPTDAGVKRLIQSSDEECWEVKRKLVWLGSHSYLFRVPFWHYLADRHVELDAISDTYARENRRIDHTDDFICQECTLWSGLGPIDILPAILDIPEAQRAEIRSWHERHAAVYRLDRVATDHVEAVNLISGAPYTIRHAPESNSFDKHKGSAVFGSVVLWKGEWHWSGTQRIFPSGSDDAVAELVRDLKRKTSIVCRYWPEQEKAVRDMHEKETRRMLDFHGGDLKLYPDGLSMAADWEREFKAAWEAHPQEKREDAVRRHGLPNGRPTVNLPPHLLDNQSGMAVFIHPDEGKEIAVDADTFIRALEKNGDNLDGDEGETVRGWVMSDSISPAFIRRILAEYSGEASIKAAFMLDNTECPYWLEYILRCYKGHYYRKRYPTLTVLSECDTSVCDLIDLPPEQVAPERTLTLAGIMDELDGNKGFFPRDAVAAAIADPKLVTPALLQSIRYATDEAERLVVEKSPYMTHLYAMYIMAQFREKRAYPLIAAFASLPGELAHYLTGDFITEDLGRVLASVCGGDQRLIRELIEGEEINEYVRGAAMHALVCLVISGQAEREDILAYFGDLLRTDFAREPSHALDDLILHAAKLCPTGIIDDIRVAFECGAADEGYISLKGVEKHFHAGPEAALKALSENRFYSLIDDTIMEMEWWSCFRHEDHNDSGSPFDDAPLFSDYDWEPSPEPIRREPLKVGRNDPCPCGSGKKHKKCCGR